MSRGAICFSSFGASRAGARAFTCTAATRSKPAPAVGDLKTVRRAIDVLRSSGLPYLRGEQRIVLIFPHENT